MVAGWNLLTNDAAAKRKVREIRAGVDDSDTELQVEVSFFDHELNPIEMGVEVEDRCPEGVVCLDVSIVSIPSGLHLPPLDSAQTRWHPTSEKRIVEVDETWMEVTVGRQVPNLVTAEVATAMVGPTKPSRVDAPLKVEVDTVVSETPSEPSPNVTAAEIAAARAESKAIKEAAKVDRTTPEERRIWGSAASRRTDRRVDTSWLWPPLR